LRPRVRLNLRPGLHRRRIALLAAVLIAAAACAPGPGTTAVGNTPPTGGEATGQAPVAAGPLAVVGTENFYADLLAQIGGSRVEATSLLNDPNADPHEFESSPRDAAAVADAKVVIVNGLGYDDFMQQLLGASPNPGRVVIDVQQLLGLDDGVNVHIWYDPTTMPKVAAAVAGALDRLDPASAAYFDAREQAYLAALQPISDKIAQMKAGYAGTPIAFTEDVAGYLTAAIGLDVKTPVGFMKAIEDGTDPAPADVAAERDLFTRREVRVLLYNSQVTSPATQQIHDLAQQQGVPIVGVAETIPPEYHTYAEWQLAQLDAIEQALKQGG
jgi:zinc/manganese transport system substrate-binding protein